MVSQGHNESDTDQDNHMLHLCSSPGTKKTYGIINLSYVYTLPCHLAHIHTWQNRGFCHNMVHFTTYAHRSTLRKDISMIRTSLMNWMSDQWSYFKIITVMSHEHHGISNYQKLICLLNSLFRLTTKKTIKLWIAGPLWGKSTTKWQISTTKW